MAVAAGAGALLGMGLGGLFGGNAADIARKRMVEAANLPGLDVGGTVGKSLTDIQANLPQAEKVAGEYNQFQTTELTKALEEAIPGYKSMLATQSGDIQSYLKGEIPQDVQDVLQQKTAEAAAAAGVPNSQLANNAFARNLGLTSLDLINQGMTGANALRASTPYAAPVDIQSLTGPTPAAEVALREQERRDQQALLAKAAGMPGKTQVWSDVFQQMGGMLGGAGIGAMAGG